MGNTQSVALDCLKAQNKEECATWYIFVFFFQKIEGGIILVSSPLLWLMHTLDLPLKIWQDEGRTALPAFVLFYLLWRKQTVYWFPVRRNCPLPFKLCYLSCAISWALYPLNSTALPIFWQLNLPYFLVIISFLWSLNAHSQGSMWSAVPQEGPI